MWICRKIPNVAQNWVDRQTIRIGAVRLLAQRMRTTQVHIFRGPGQVFAFTADPSGANLPPKYAPWTAFKMVELQQDVPTPGVDVNDCLRDIAAHGVHVTDAHVRITEDAIR